MCTEIYITRNSIMPGSISRDSVCARVCEYIHIYIYMPEYRTACFIDRDKIRLHLPPSLPLPLSCFVHESRHARKFSVGPIFRFAHIFARSSLRRERNLALALRLARDREGETSRELNERSASGDRTMHNDE